VVEYIKINVEALDKSKRIVETTKKIIKYILLKMKKRNSFKRKLFEIYTKRKKNRKEFSWSSLL
jgi:hypothetical protein